MTRIAYISQRFPSLTTTFVYREVLALRRLGLHIRSISTWRPNPKTLSAEAQGLVDETFYIFPLNYWQLLGHHARYLFTRPARYWGALAQLILFNREGLANRVRSLGHFVYAVCAAAEVERSGAQHIHADFALNAATVALVAARLTGRTFSFAAHANDIFVNPVLLREKVRQAAFVTPISEFNRRYLLSLDRETSAAERLHVIHCGLAFSQFSPNGQIANTGRPLILGVGRLVEKKGFHILIEACRWLKEQGVSFECQIVGGGPQEARLRELIQHHGVAECVQLTGPQPQERVRALMQHAAVFALPCVVAQDHDQDGIPVALMEAMAFERPVISTPISGIPELVQDQVNGLLVASGQARELAGAIQRLLEDAPLARRLGQAGRQTVAKEFNVERSAQQLAELFQQVTAHSRE